MRGGAARNAHHNHHTIMKNPCLVLLVAALTADLSSAQNAQHFLTARGTSNPSNMEVWDWDPTTGAVNSTAYPAAQTFFETVLEIDVAEHSGGDVYTLNRNVSTGQSILRRRMTSPYDNSVPGLSAIPSSTPGTPGDQWTDFMVDMSPAATPFLGLTGVEVVLAGVNSGSVFLERLNQSGVSKGRTVLASPSGQPATRALVAIDQATGNVHVLDDTGALYQTDWASPACSRSPFAGRSRSRRRFATWPSTPTWIPLRAAAWRWRIRAWGASRVGSFATPSLDSPTAPEPRCGSGTTGT